ncbi:MAG: hypothetical protein GF404_02240 [candidate division Zixibacteria bacterium]|nr:hypothetical protein [candidate division Zixibacteria bacterium]
MKYQHCISFRMLIKAAFLSVLLLSIASAEPINTYLPDTVIYKGDTLRLAVEVDHVDLSDQVYSYTVEIRYNPMELEVVGIDNHNSISSGAMFTSNILDTVVIVACASEKEIYGSGNLFFIELTTAVEAVSGQTSELKAVRGVFNDNSPDCFWHDGEVLIMVTGGCGDANADGINDASDVSFVMNYMFNGGPAPDPPESADVNCDTKVNMLDLVFLVDFVFRDGHDPCDTDGDNLPDC